MVTCEHPSDVNSEVEGIGDPLQFHHRSIQLRGKVRKLIYYLNPGLWPKSKKKLDFDYIFRATNM